ncbi:MAG: FKBP-type peptidyl-prolyl cis-trans isomerase FkpA [Sulfurimonas sp.]|jgi:FKBP-type peptidyl-prolyl cis-trans isomerase FkpA
MKLAEKKVYMILPLFLALLGTQSSATELKTSVQLESYSIGASTGNYIVNQIYGQVQMGAKIDMALVAEGFNDALIKKSQLDDDKIITNLNNRAEYLNKVQVEASIKEKKDNSIKEKNYLEKNSKKDGVVVTKSGLQYKVTKFGKGESPKLESTVIIDYKASLVDGYEFDNTYNTKKPAHLSMINVVNGLKEGLMLMKAGSKFTLYIPSSLGYGDVQMVDIPPNSVLIFEIELKEVIKPGGIKKKK